VTGPAGADEKTFDFLKDRRTIFRAHPCYFWIRNCCFTQLP